MTILYGFKLDANGKIIHRLFDSARMPNDWFDAPDKAERAANPPKIEQSILNPLQDIKQAEKLARPTLTLDPRFAKPKVSK